MYKTLLTHEINNQNIMTSIYVHSKAA